MSVIVLAPKELANIRNLFHQAASGQIDRDAIDHHLAALMVNNAATCDARYPRDERSEPFTIDDLKRYFKITMTKLESIEAVESFRSLVYNCDLSQSPRGQLAYRYLSMALLRWLELKLKTSWGVEQ